MYAISGKDQRKPPVGPKNGAIPLLKLAKTGNPRIPIHKYKSKILALCFGVNSKAMMIIPNTCKVKGTPKGKGIEICAQIIKSTSAIAICVSCFVFIVDHPF